MMSAGILEEMFNGAGFEYLYYDQDSNYAVGFEMFDVKKRDYMMRFGTLDYRNVTAHLNFYYRNYGRLPFDTKISYGEYLAGDEGLTIDLSRSFSNGTKFGIFASFLLMFRLMILEKAVLIKVFTSIFQYLGT